jgi:hypothetical protein
LHCYAVGFEQVLPFVRCDGECDVFLTLLGAFNHFGRQGVLEVDAIPWEIELCWIGVVSQNVSTQDEPVSVVL